MLNINIFYNFISHRKTIFLPVLNLIFILIIILLSIIFFNSFQIEVMMVASVQRWISLSFASCINLLEFIVNTLNTFILQINIYLSLLIKLISLGLVVILLLNSFNIIGIEVAFVNFLDVFITINFKKEKKLLICFVFLLLFTYDIVIYTFIGFMIFLKIRKNKRW